MKVAKDLKKKFNERNGITLIALVITIIVLLILAGVSIMMLTGDNSILRQATNAKQRTGEGTEAEQVKMAAMAAVADSTVNLSREIDKAKLEKELQKYFSGATVSEDGEDYIYEGQYKTYRISKNGTVTEEAPSAVSIQFVLSDTPNIPDPETDDNVKELKDTSVPIPTGFYYVGGTKNSGLVISDAAADENKGVNAELSGNQFVWVPVNQGQTLTLIVKTDERIQSIKLIRPDGTEEDLPTTQKTQEISMKSNGVYLNGIYRIKVKTTSGLQTTQTIIRTLYGQDYTLQQLEIEKQIEEQVLPILDTLKSQAIETYSTTAELLEAKSKSSVEELLTETSQDSMLMYMYTNKIYVEDQEESVREEYMAIAGVGISIYTDNSQQQESVEKYGGFYIARYEAGDASASETDPRESSSETSGAVVSKKGSYIYNYVTKSQASTLAYGMYNTSAVKSQLITGAGWDRTLNWLVETGMSEESIFSDSKERGNYSDSTKDTNINGESNMNYTTGRSENWEANNIYDLAGNIFECTNEKSSDSSLTCVLRGGMFISEGSECPASCRFNDIEGGSGSNFSFRVTLYLQP